MPLLEEDHRTEVRRRYDKLSAVDKNYLGGLEQDCQQARVLAKRRRGSCTSHFAIFTEALPRRVWIKTMFAHNFHRSTLRLDFSEEPNAIKRLGYLAKHINETSSDIRITVRVCEEFIDGHTAVILGITPI